MYKSPCSSEGPTLEQAMVDDKDDAGSPKTHFDPKPQSTAGRGGEEPQSTTSQPDTQNTNEQNMNSAPSEPPVRPGLSLAAPEPAGEAAPPPYVEPPKVSAAFKDIFFCFGHGKSEYVFKSPHDLLYNMPTDVADVLERSPIKHIKSLSVGRKDALWIHYEDTNGKAHQYKSPEVRKHYKKLDRWIDAVLTKGEGPLTVAFGSGRCEYVAASLSQAKFVTEGLDLAEQLNKANHFRNISVGAKPNYAAKVSVNNSESLLYRGKTTLEWWLVIKEIFRTDRSLEFVALHPKISGYYFFLTQTGKAYYNVNPNIKARLEAALNKCGIKTCTFDLSKPDPATAGNAANSPTIAELQAQVTNLEKKIDAKVGTAAVGGLLVGAALCNVM